MRATKTRGGQTPSGPPIPKAGCRPFMPLAFRSFSRGPFLPIWSNYIFFNLKNLKKKLKIFSKLPYRGKKTSRLRPKLTLGRTSEMTPEGRCTVFSADLHSLRGLSGTPFSEGNPQNRQKVPKIGGTPFWGIFLGSSPFSGV